MWLENLKALKKEKGLSSKQIADATNLPERTVSRIFSGDTPNPYLDTLNRIVTVLGGSLYDILADSKTVLGSKSLAELQAELDKIQEDLATLKEDLAVHKNKLVVLTAERDRLLITVQHKDELLAIHNHYSAVIGGLAKEIKKRNQK